MIHFRHLNPVELTRIFDSKLPCQGTHFQIVLFRDLPPGINFLVSLLMQALFTCT